MHIPDGFLNLPVAVVTYLITIIFCVIAFKRARKIVDDKHVPMLAILASAIFAAQMLNFPVGGGTSGHLLGAALVAILLGPNATIIIMTIILVIQALIFADGGITALGANILNMGVVGGFIAYATYSLIKSVNKNFAIFLASWLSVVIASGVCAIELGLSGTSPIFIALVAMVTIHNIIGVGEGLITIGILMFIKKVRPDLLKLQKF